METTFLGIPKVDKKENHKIIKVVAKNGFTERSKDLFEKDYSIQLNETTDNSLQDSIKLFKKNHKITKRSYFFYIYEHNRQGTWTRLSGGYLHNA